MSLRVLPDRIAVLWPLEPEGLFVVPDAIKLAEANRRMTPATKVCKVLSSGFWQVREGDLVAIRMDAAGLILDRTDYPWIPEGYEVRIYGVTEPILDNGDRDNPAHPENDILFAKVS